MKFSDRLQSFGYATYAEYLASERWAAFKESYRKSGRPMRCAVCFKGPIQLHHHDYRRVCEERIRDITPLCSLHHQEVHAKLKAEGWPVVRTHQVVAELRRGVRGAKKKAKSKTLPLTEKMRAELDALIQKVLEVATTFNQKERVASWSNPDQSNFQKYMGNLRGLAKSIARSPRKKPGRKKPEKKKGGAPAPRTVGDYLARMARYGH